MISPDCPLGLPMSTHSQNLSRHAACVQAAALPALKAERWPGSAPGALTAALRRLSAEASGPPPPGLTARAFGGCNRSALDHWRKHAAGWRCVLPGAAALRLGGTAGARRPAESRRARAEGTFGSPVSVLPSLPASAGRWPHKSDTHVRLTRHHPAATTKCTQAALTQAAGNGAMRCARALATRSSSRAAAIGGRRTTATRQGAIATRRKCEGRRAWQACACLLCSHTATSICLTFGRRRG
eukprot:329259-Chlamydomonas_euryale.AAC.3